MGHEYVEIKNTNAAIASYRRAVGVSSFFYSVLSLSSALLPVFARLEGGGTVHVLVEEIEN
jgi:anaphase-promoting complex subunit 8